MKKREIALKKMDAIADDFYRQAVGVNNHPFILFPCWFETSPFREICLKLTLMLCIVILSGNLVVDGEAIHRPLSVDGCHSADEVECGLKHDLHEKIEPDNLCRAMLEKFPGLKADMSKSEGIDVKLLELFKSYGQEQKLFRIDREMSDFLGLKRATISSVRTGRSKFGPLPRLRMLKAINPEVDIDQVLNGLESKQWLLDLIEKHIEIQSNCEVGK